MTLHRALCDAQLRGDLLVTFSLNDQGEYVLFAAGERGIRSATGQTPATEGGITRNPALTLTIASTMVSGGMHLIR